MWCRVLYPSWEHSSPALWVLVKSVKPSSGGRDLEITYLSIHSADEEPGPQGGRVWARIWS